ncbi:hypothetical protein ACOSQ3_013740 [Xanthoceras sorbifolium]
MRVTLHIFFFVSLLLFWVIYVFGISCFWICLILTILGYIPGIIYAIYVSHTLLICKHLSLSLSLSL